MRGKPHRLRRPSFVPTLHGIRSENIGVVPGLSETIAYWTGGSCDVSGWVERLMEGSSGCGYYLSRGDEVTGFCVYAPGDTVPLVPSFPFSSVGEGEMMLVCVAGDDRTARRLLVRMLRDFRLCGVSRVLSVASDGGREHHAPTELLIGSGWRPIERRLYRGRFYTLVGLEIGNTVEAGELARNFIGQVGQVRLPHLGPVVPATLAAEEEPDVRRDLRPISPAR